MLLLVSHLVGAALLTLQDGTVLNGRLIKVEKDLVVWNLASVGDLRIQKKEIVFIETQQKLRLKGKNRPCYWSSFDPAAIAFSCEDGKDMLIPFLSMSDIVPFIGYKEALRFRQGKLTLTGSEAQGNLVSGNSEEEKWRVGLDILYRHTDFRHEVRASYEGESFNESEFFDRIKSFYGFDWFFRPKWFLFTDLRAEYDDILRLDYKFELGSGFGYQFWETDLSAFSIGSGTSYILEQYEVVDQNTGDSRRQFVTLDFNSRYRNRIPLGMNFEARLDFTQSVEESVDWRFDSAAGLTLPVRGGVGAEISYEYSYDNLPALGNFKRDSILRLGVSYSW